MAPLHENGVEARQMHQFAPLGAAVKAAASEFEGRVKRVVSEWSELVPKSQPRRRTKVMPGAWRMKGPSAAGASAVAFSPLSRGCFAAMIPGDSAVEAVVTAGLYNTLNIYNTLIIGRLILTWFPNPPMQIVGPLATICDPYLNLFRGIIPPIGGSIDLSPILAFVCLNFFTSTAAALPCEGPPPTGASAKWAKRMQACAQRRLGLPVKPVNVDEE
eukprot:CAMPEP_0196582270 /NCGR_PEP_ID=MMETSP1081-20130531/38407_1 /TAXON_ID=36882 /ORGANISM="Pyramimonas amylifera, Strain CCMP720" /LENGTH=215 /DNA_ID=CAMNT_0041902793 /DNA_START=76 /DNA_END=723 /DNA_ORIENTATION=-